MYNYPFKPNGINIISPIVYNLSPHTAVSPRHKQQLVHDIWIITRHLPKVTEKFNVAWISACFAYKKNSVLFLTKE